MLSTPAQLAIAAATSILALALGGCGGGANADGSSQANDSTQADSADTSCQIVLRRLTHADGANGASVGIDPKGEFIWNATADIANTLLQQGATANLSWSASQGDWTSIAGTQTTGAASGFTRLAFTFDALSPASSSIDNGDVYAVPFAQMPDGTRLFDHNVNSDPNGNYDLPSRNTQGITIGPNTCPGK
jgi:hypothetical protein